MSDHYSKLRYHVIVGTLEQRPFLAPPLLDRLYGYLGGIARRQGDHVLAVGGVADHVHLLLGLPTTHRLSDTLRLLKTNSSRWLKRLEPTFAWDRGYAAFGVSECQVPEVTRYVLMQGERHRSLTSSDELRRYLELHELEAPVSQDPSRRQSHHRLYHHLVFGTKNRYFLITSEVEAALHATLAEVVERIGGRAIAIGGMPDHVHLLIETRPTASLAEVVKRIKGASSRWMSEEGAPHTPFAWQSGYSCFTVSQSMLETVHRYIATQREHHARWSFTDEFHSLLKEHGLEKLPSPKGDRR